MHPENALRKWFYHWTLVASYILCYQGQCLLETEGFYCDKINNLVSSAFYLRTGIVVGKVALVLSENHTRYSSAFCCLVVSVHTLLWYYVSSSSSFKYASSSSSEIFSSESFTLIFQILHIILFKIVPRCLCELVCVKILLLNVKGGSWISDRFLEKTNYVVCFEGSGLKDIFQE